VIEFLCPNGHQIHCPDSQAGRAAKCPRCGVKFRIPNLSEASGLQQSGGEAASPELTDSGDFTSASPPAGPPAAKDPQIEFLCPNGHLLHGPSGLQGRPGECPECGCRFRIPTYDDLNEEAEQQVAVGPVEAGEQRQGAVSQGEKMEEPAAARTGGNGPDEGSRSGSKSGISGSSISTDGGLSLPALFAKLWTEKARGASIEVRFRDGETLLPDRYLYKLSQQTHGVFAVKDASGTHTLSVVPWDTVARVVVRGVKTLPEK